MTSIHINLLPSAADLQAARVLRAERAQALADAVVARPSPCINLHPDHSRTFKCGASTSVVDSMNMAEQRRVLLPLVPGDTFLPVVLDGDPYREVWQLLEWGPYGHLYDRFERDKLSDEDRAWVDGITAVARQILAEIEERTWTSDDACVVYLWQQASLRAPVGVGRPNAVDECVWQTVRLHRDGVQGTLGRPILQGALEGGAVDHRQQPWSQAFRALLGRHAELRRKQGPASARRAIEADMIALQALLDGEAQA